MVVYANPMSEGERVSLDCLATPTLTRDGALTCDVQLPAFLVTGTYDPNDLRLILAGTWVPMQSSAEKVKFQGISAEEWQRIKATKYGVKLSK